MTTEPGPKPKHSRLTKILRTPLNLTQRQRFCYTVQYLTAFKNGIPVPIPLRLPYFFYYKRTDLLCAGATGGSPGAGQLYRERNQKVNCCDIAQRT